MDAVVCKNSIYIDLDLYPNLCLNTESRSIYINMKKDVKRLFVWYRIFDILLSNYFMTSSSCVIVHTRYISRKTFQLFLNNWIFAIMKKKIISEQIFGFAPFWCIQWNWGHRTLRLTNQLPNLLFFFLSSLHVFCHKLYNLLIYMTSKTNFPIHQVILEIYCFRSVSFL